MTVRWRRCRRCALVWAMVLSAFCLFLWNVWPPPLPVGPPPIYDDPSMPQHGANNIFFIETTCAIKDSPWPGVKPRQACAVESAVRHNPAAHVYLFHTCAAPAGGVLLPDGATALHVPMAEFLSDTPLYGPIVESGALAASQWPVEHASDIMRIVALWKYGGIYLDLDCVVIKNLSELGEDWIFAVDANRVGNSAINFSTKNGSAGVEVAKECMKELRDHYKNNDWTYNGPKLLKRVFTRRCKTDKTAKMKKCRGFTVLPSELLFPIHFESWEHYFTEEDAYSTLAKTANAFAVHVWNKKSRNTKKVNPNSAYATISRKNCPVTYGSTSDYF